jgi:4a-hydroxytetrahydrobiopterin dehydratase
MPTLSNKHCLPCEGGTKPLDHEESEALLHEINGWKLLNDSPAKNLAENLGGQAIEKTFEFKNFGDAIVFVNKVGEIAEKEGHHPDINLQNWRYVTLHLSTHAIDGLSDNDFILAAKIDNIR